MKALFRVHRRGFPRSQDFFFRFSQDDTEEVRNEIARHLLGYCYGLTHPSIRENPLDKPAFFITLEGYEFENERSEH